MTEFTLYRLTYDLGGRAWPKRISTLPMRAEKWRNGAAQGNWAKRIAERQVGGFPY